MLVASVNLQFIHSFIHIYKGHSLNTMPTSAMLGETKNKARSFYLQVPHSLGGKWSRPVKGTEFESPRSLPSV